MRRKILFISAALAFASVFLQVAAAEETKDLEAPQAESTDRTERVEEKEKLVGVNVDMDPETAEGDASKKSQDAGDGSSSAPAAKLEPGIKSGQSNGNLIRFKLERGGKKMEVQLDPKTVDAFIDVRYGKDDEDEADAEKREEVLDDRMKKAPSRRSEAKDEVQDPEKEKQDKEMDKKVQDMMKDFDDDKKKKSLTDSVLTHIMKAQKLFYEGEYEAALDEAKASVRMQRTAAGYSLLGSIFYMMEDTEGAIAAWQKSVALEPNQPDVQEMLDYLK